MRDTRLEKQTENQKRVAVIGGGFSGCQIAEILARECRKENVPVEVIVFESGEDILGHSTEENGDNTYTSSAVFTSREHKGAHYLKNPITRKYCQNGSARFSKEFPELVREGTHSLYGLAMPEDGKPLEVSKKHFDQVCKNSAHKREIIVNDNSAIYQSLRVENIKALHDTTEQYFVSGAEARATFKNYFKTSGVKVRCSTKVKKIKKQGPKFIVTSEGMGAQNNKVFDYVINATGYQTFFTDKPELPFKLKPVYQPCLGLKYMSQKPFQKPFSINLMQGVFPGLLPSSSKLGRENQVEEFVVTHVGHTILGSYDTPEKAKEALRKVDIDFVRSKIKPPSENDLERYLPDFKNNFEFIGYVGAVIAKVGADFRVGFSFLDETGGICYFPGKVSHATLAGIEIAKFILGQAGLVREKRCQYIEGGVLDQSKNTLSSKNDFKGTDVARLQNYREILDKMKRKDAGDELFKQFYKECSRKSKESKEFPDSSNELSCSPQNSESYTDSPRGNSDLVETDFPLEGLYQSSFK